MAQVLRLQVGEALGVEVLLIGVQDRDDGDLMHQGLHEGAHPGVRTNAAAWRSTAG